jgi:hypothetical protein
VDIVTSYGLGGRILFSTCQDFSFCTESRSDLRLTMPYIDPMGATDSFPAVKPPEHEADHSPPSSAEVQNAGTICLHDILLQ